MKKNFYYYNQPLYAIFKKENGTLYGYIERSFCMDWSKDTVRLWPKEYILPKNKKHMDDNDIKKFINFKPKDKLNNIFITRVRNKKCPVDIVFDDLKNISKFNFRNKKFSLKSK